MSFDWIHIGDTYKMSSTGFEIENWSEQHRMDGGYESADVGKYFCLVGNPSELGYCYEIYKILEVTDGSITKSMKHVVDKPIFDLSTSGIYKAEDDYGTSYYYRGAVENNYVVFANMCWRVVRVVGDGSIKLTLYNYNPDAVTNPCDTSKDGYANAFARYSGTTYKTVFNTQYNNAKYIGYMYGIASSSRAQAVTNETNSTIKSNLDTWYTSKLSSQASNIVDTIYCNDRQLRSEVGGPATGAGFGYDETYYAGYHRLVTTKTPSLKCGLKNDSFTITESTKGNGKLTNPIGLLTADEITFAGGVYENDNKNYYLYKNSEGGWWTSSPAYIEWGESRVFAVNSNYYGGISVYYSGYFANGYVGDAAGLRPAVTLKSTTKITGLGTSSNPFKVV